jgi:hypothetical protein
MLDLDNKQSQSHIVAGLSVICIGLLVLILSRAFIRNHVPIVTYITPVFITMGFIWAATAVKNALLSIAFAVLALLAATSYFTEIAILRQVIGLACIALGFLLLFYIFYVGILNKQPQK